jgi:hypothetical protein
MPDERRKPDVEHFSTKEKLLKDLGKALIGDLLKQRAAAIAALDEKLANLGHPAYFARAKTKATTRSRCLRRRMLQRQRRNRQLDPWVPAQVA